MMRHRWWVTITVTAVWLASPLASQVCPETRQEARQMQLNEVEFVLVDVENSGAKEVRAAAHFEAPAAAMIEVIRAAEQYAEFMPRVRTSEVEINDQGRFNRQEVDFPFPISNRSYQVQLFEGESPAGDWELRWEYVEGSGNIAATHGFWRVVDLDESSLLCYEVFSDPGGHIPDWAINKASRSTVPKLLQSVAARAAAVAQQSSQ